MQLSMLEDQIRSAYRAERTADQIADCAIRFSLRRRVALEQMMKQARDLVPAEERQQWLARLGIAAHEAAKLFTVNDARRTKRAENAQSELPPEDRDIPISLKGIHTLLGELTVALETAAGDRVAAIGRRA